MVLSVKVNNWNFLITLNSFTDDPFQKTGVSAKENILASALLSISPVDERSQCETLENSGKASFHNLASSQEEEMTCGLTSSTETEISEQGKLGDKHEAAQLECTESLTESSKTPLLSRYLWNVFVSLFC